MSFKDKVTDTIHQPGIEGIEVGREMHRVQLSGLSIRLVQDILLISTEHSRIASISEAFQLFFCNVRKIEASIARTTSVNVRNITDMTGTERNPLSQLSRKTV